MWAVLEHDFRSDVGFWIHAAAHRFERAMNAELSAEGLTYRQCQVLGWLALDGNLAQFELAERMNVEPPTLVRVLDCMERAELVERAACPEDRRRKVVVSTAKAVPVWEKIVACANRVRDRSVGGLSRDEQGTLRHLLQKVHDNLGTETAPGRLNPDAPRESPAATDCTETRRTLQPHRRRTGVVRP